MVSTSTLAATIKISNYLNLRHKSVIIPSSSSISFFSSSARTRSFAITLLKPISATAQHKYVYPDPIPEFSEAETLKFRAELTKKLMKDNDEFGDQIYDVVNVCAEVWYSHDGWDGLFVVSAQHVVATRITPISLKAK